MDVCPHGCTPESFDCQVPRLARLFAVFSVMFVMLSLPPLSVGQFIPEILRRVPSLILSKSARWSHTFEPDRFLYPA